MDPPVEMMISPARTVPTQSLLRRLARVVLPVRIQARVEAAASLPLWVAGPMIVLAVAVLSEIVVYNIELADRNFGWLEFRPRVLEMVFREPMAFFAALLVLGLILVGLEALSLLLFAPFSTAMGQRLRDSQGKCRKVVYSLGGVWAVQAGILWTLITLFVAPGILQVVEVHAYIGYVADIFVAVVFCGVLPLALLLGWVFTLLRACSQLAQGRDPPLAVRCGECGYFLEGLAPGAACPECGLPNPGWQDRARRPSTWASSRGIGRLVALVETTVLVAVRPARFFSEMRVLGQSQETRRFLIWTIWSSMPLAVLSVPGILAAWSSNGIDRGDWCMIWAIMALIALGSALVLITILGLLIGLVGLAIGRARQEPAWPIAAAAGGYLAGLIPWVATVQAMWLWPLFTANRHSAISNMCRAIGQWLRIDWEFIFAFLLLAPAIAGLFLAFRTAVVCYKNVRYACR